MKSESLPRCTDEGRCADSPKRLVGDSPTEDTQVGSRSRRGNGASHVQGLNYTLFLQTKHPRGM